MKNRKEYVVCDNEKGRIWRISKKLCRIKRGRGFRYVAKTLDIHIFEGRFYLKWSSIGESKSEKRRISFKVKNGKVIPYLVKGLGAGQIPIRYTYEPLLYLKEIKKGVNAKINRVLNKEYGLKYKIGVPFYKNVLKVAFPHYLDFYPDPKLEMAKVITKPSIKKSIKSYCGFAGKKLLADLLAYPEFVQKNKLDTIKFLRKHLTFGEIDIPQVQTLPKTAKQSEIKKLVDLNPQFFKKYLLRDNDQKNPNHPTWNTPLYMYLPDTIRMYISIAKFVDIESTTLSLAKAKNLKEYHDSLAKYHRKMQTENLPFDEYDFSDSEVGDFTIKVCKDSHELIEWSTYMGNCVSSYRERILDGKIIMCGLFRDGVLAYNLSLRKIGKKFHIDQLNSRYNRGYSESDFALVETFVAELKNVLPRQKETVSIGCE